jgi:L-fuculose-phosphate aldolase
MLVREDGSTEGCHKPSLELQLHQAVYKARPDIRAVLHAHSPALMAFSMLRQLPDFSLIPNTRMFVAASRRLIMLLWAAWSLPKGFEKMNRGANSVLMDNMASFSVRRVWHRL